jgi:hypothetical protein
MDCFWFEPSRPKWDTSGDLKRISRNQIGRVFRVNENTELVYND